MWPPKGTNGCENTSFEPLCVKIAPKLWPVAATKKGIDRYVNKKKSTQNRVFFTHAQIRNGRIDSNQILHTNSLGDVVIYLTWYRNWLRGFGWVGCENWPLPFTLALASNSAYCATAHTRDVYVFRLTNEGNLLFAVIFLFNYVDFIRYGTWISYKNVSK